MKQAPLPRDNSLKLDANEMSHYDPDGARRILMRALLCDIRCIDAHAHLGNLEFDRRPETALKHYDIAIAIGELFLGTKLRQ